MKTKERIIITAMTLFAEQGIKETSISEIAQNAGISKAVIYHYFESKDNILRCVLDNAIDTLDTEMAKAMEIAEQSNVQKRPGRELLHYVHIMSRIDRQPIDKAFRFVLSNSFYIDELREYILTEYIKRPTFYVKRCLDRMVALEQSAEFDTASLSRILSYHLVSVTLKYITHYPLVDNSLYLEVMHDIRYVIRCITSGHFA